jgi:hypothetical protein
MRDLNNLDKRLGTKFNGNNFVITYDRGFGEPVNVMLVKRDDGGFRQPDRRDIESLRKGDLATGESMDVRLRKLAYASERMRTDLRKKHRDNIRDMTKDDRIYLGQKFAQLTNQGKANSAFRRINHKPSKNTVMVVQ